MFQVKVEDGAKCVLRIYSDGESTLLENQAEMFWLDAIKRDTSLRVTEPVPRRDGAYISIIDMDGVPGGQRGVLFRWIPGTTLESRLNADNYYKLGQVMAQLHDHAQTLNPLPDEIQPKIWNKVFYYTDEPVVFDTEAYRHLFPPDRLALLLQVIERSESLLGRLFADGAGRMLIHGDMHF